MANQTKPSTYTDFDFFGGNLGGLKAAADQFKQGNVTPDVRKTLEGRGVPEGDINLEAAINKLGTQGTDISNVDWHQIPEALRNYLRGGGQVQGKLSDLVTGAQQAQAQVSQTTAPQILQQLFPGLASANSPTAQQDAQTQAYTDAITPLLQHIHDQESARSNLYNSLATNYLNNTRFAPGVKDILQQFLPFLQQQQQQTANDLESQMLQNPLQSQLMAQLKATQTASQAAAKAAAGGSATGGVVSRKPDGSIQIGSG